MTLASNEIVSIRGDLAAQLAALPRRRKYDALIAAIAAGSLKLVGGSFGTVTNSAPLTGSTVTVNANGADETINLTPAGTIATLTLLFPTNATSSVGQRIEVFTSQIVTALTVTVPGGTVGGDALTATTANGSYLFVKTAANTWLRLR